MKITTLFITLLLWIMFSACEPQDESFRDFYIPQGDHYSTTHIIQSIQSNKLKFDAKFDGSARYQFQEESFQDSKNKLLGFSDCNSRHHENSARFAWQWLNDQLEIYAYCYVNGERKEKFVGIVSIDEVNHYELSVTGSHYIFQLNHDEPVLIERENICNVGVYYMLWPYFGGTLPAPHNVTIKLRILN